MPRVHTSVSVMELERGTHNPLCSTKRGRREKYGLETEKAEFCWRSRRLTGVSGNIKCVKKVDDAVVGNVLLLSSSGSDCKDLDW